MLKVPKRKSDKGHEDNNDQNKKHLAVSLSPGGTSIDPISPLTNNNFLVSLLI